MKEIDELVQAAVEIIALDATDRLRPSNVTLDEFVSQIRSKYPNQLIMADVSTYEEGIKAWKLGFDLVSTTLSGYTPYSKKGENPDFDLIERLSRDTEVPIIAEGKIWTREDAVEALKRGAHAVVVGTAITRPADITRRFVQAVRK